MAGTEVKELWKAEIGIGFASFTVADGRVFTSGHADGQDTVFCFDAATGKPVWKHSYKAELGDKYYEGGTSAGPVIEGDKAWHLSRWCLEQGLLQQDPQAMRPDGAAYIRRSDYGRYLEQTLSDHAHWPANGTDPLRSPRKLWTRTSPCS